MKVYIFKLSNPIESSGVCELLALKLPSFNGVTFFPRVSAALFNGTLKSELLQSCKVCARGLAINSNCTCVCVSECACPKRSIMYGMPGKSLLGAMCGGHWQVTTLMATFDIDIRQTWFRSPDGAPSANVWFMTPVLNTRGYLHSLSAQQLQRHLADNECHIPGSRQPSRHKIHIEHWRARVNPALAYEWPAHGNLLVD